MSLDLAILQGQPPEIPAWLIWVFFVALPLLARVGGWLVEVFTKVRGDGTAEPTAEGSPAQKAKCRFEEVQKEGSDAWRELMEGLELKEEQAPPASAKDELAEDSPAPTPAESLADVILVEPPQERPAVEESAPPPPPPPLVTPPRTPLAPTPAAPEPVASSPSFPLRGERAPLRGVLRKPSARPTTTLPSEGKVGSRLSGIPLAERQDAPRVAAAPARVALPSGLADWRRAVLWSEVFGPPVSLRTPGGPSSPAGLR